MTLCSAVAAKSCRRRTLPRLAARGNVAERLPSKAWAWPWSQRRPSRRSPDPTARWLLRCGGSRRACRRLRRHRAGSGRAGVDPGAVGGETKGRAPSPHRRSSDRSSIRWCPMKKTRRRRDLAPDQHARSTETARLASPRTSGAPGAEGEACLPATSGDTCTVRVSNADGRVRLIDGRPLQLHRRGRRSDVPPHSQGWVSLLVRRGLSDLRSPPASTERRGAGLGRGLDRARRRRTAPRSSSSSEGIIGRHENARRFSRLVSRCLRRRAAGWRRRPSSCGRGLLVGR